MAADDDEPLRQASRQAADKPAGSPLTSRLSTSPPPSRATEINVVLVADVDMISPAFFQLREQADIPELGIRFDFDNVTFVLNALDELAGDDRFIAIRSHRPKHRTLTRIEDQTKAAKSDAAEQRSKYDKECAKKEADEQAELDKKNSPTCAAARTSTPWKWPKNSISP